MPDPTTTSTVSPGIIAHPAPPATPRDPSRWVPLIPIGLALLIAAIAGLWPRTTPRHAHDMPAPALPANAQAPDFSLPDAHDPGAAPISLREALKTAPVLLIFYQGYSCPRCVTHLHALADELDEFDKAGLQILAISSDTPAATRESVALYGDFPFPLLSDADGKVARAYGLFDGQGHKFHGAFVIDRHAHVRLAAASEHPYEDLDILLALGHALQQEK